MMEGMGGKLHTDETGRRWCRHRIAKVVYATSDDAWRIAFRIFAETGFILTPYRCGRKIERRAFVEIRITGNPWAVYPLRCVRRAKRRDVVGCGNWHLTSKTWFMLPRADCRLMRNQAGLVIGPERQCLRATGISKQIYATESDAQAAIAAANMKRYRPYLCSKGHWHIGHRERRPIIVWVEGENSRNDLPDARYTDIRTL